MKRQRFYSPPLASLDRVVLLATLLLMTARGCASLRRIQVFTVSIVNDTGNTVVVRDCDSFCSSSPLVFNLASGSSVDIHRTARAHKYFSITTPSGAHIGCVDLYFKVPEDGAQVPVSQAVPCPSGSGLPWKTIGLVLLALLPVSALLVWRRSSRVRTGTRKTLYASSRMDDPDDLDRTETQKEWADGAAHGYRKLYQPRSMLWFGGIFSTLFTVGLVAVIVLVASGRWPRPRVRPA